MAYWRLHYHLVWATHERHPWLQGDIERMVYGTLLGKAEELGAIIHQIGNTDDHIHVVASIPPKFAVAECVRHFKGASSRYVNTHAELDFRFKWQNGYGAISFGERSMGTVSAYVRDQRQRHARRTTTAYYERMTEEDVGPDLVGPPQARKPAAETD